MYSLISAGMFSNSINKTISIIIVGFTLILILNSCNKDEVIIAEQKHDIILLNKYNYNLPDTLLANIRLRNNGSQEYFKYIKFIETSPDTFQIADQIITTVDYTEIEMDLYNVYNHDVLARKYNIPSFVNDSNRDLVLYITQGGVIVENFQVSELSDTSATIEYEIYDEGPYNLAKTEVLLQVLDSSSNTIIDYGVFPTIKPAENFYRSYLTGLTPDTNYKVRLIHNFENNEPQTRDFFDFTTDSE
jgi:hypothetical protein